MKYDYRLYISGPWSTPPHSASDIIFAWSLRLAENDSQHFQFLTRLSVNSLNGCEVSDCSPILTITVMMSGRVRRTPLFGADGLLGIEGVGTNNNNKDILQVRIGYY